MAETLTSPPARLARPDGSPVNVLVFPGATEIGLEIRNALAACKEVRLFSAAVAGSSHAPYVYLRHAELPSVREPGWLEAFNALLAQQEIDFVLPAHDDVVLAVAESASRIRATVVGSPAETCRIARSKAATYRRFAGILPVPRTWASPVEVDRFPVFLKPDRGQGSQGTLLARSREELAFHLGQRPDLLVSEHLPGKEYTVDCFSDRERGLLFCAGRERVRTRNGISVDSRPVELPAFQAYAARIAAAVPLHGPWFFQVKEDSHGELRLLEFAPRIAGTMALFRATGVNFPLLGLCEAWRIPVAIVRNRVQVRIDRALVNRFAMDLDYGTVYVDLDDTLILRGQVNAQLVRFLYQCLNAGKRLVLLTRHAGDPRATLERFRLSTLFDQVIHLEAGQAKADFVPNRDAIFIDDSFAERRRVSERTGAPTFDCSMVEALLDERA